jgi:hypothetical protein
MVLMSKEELCFVLTSSPTIKDCIFINNEAEYTGGAIYLSDSNSKILNCVFVGNTARLYGSGISFWNFSEGFN